MSDGNAGTIAPQYEFSAEMDELFQKLGHKMRVVGFIGIVLGLIALAHGGSLLSLLIQGGQLPQPQAGSKPIPQELLYIAAGMYLVSGLIYLSIGIWTRGAGGGFQAIAATHGNDLELLRTALTQQHKAYSLMYTIIMIGVILFGLALVSAILTPILSK